MLEGKAVIGETDMLQTMQQDALDLASKALDFFDVTEAIEIARFIKKEFDRMHGPGSLAILLFRGSTALEAEENQFSALEATKA
ncbi:Dynein light chain, type 1/2 [Sesbania bispinosa]|nr:Dynein light chain, type 1/2 [Sesbania bispinosa]